MKHLSGVVRLRLEHWYVCVHDQLGYPVLGRGGDREELLEYFVTTIYHTQMKYEIYFTRSSGSRSTLPDFIIIQTPLICRVMSQPPFWITFRGWREPTCTWVWTRSCKNNMLELSWFNCLLFTIGTYRCSHSLATSVSLSLLQAMIAQEVRV